MPDAHARAHRLSLTLAVVLTVGSGAMDAIGFSRLGDVFTSVMTGNLVLLGLSAGSGSAAIAERIAIALVAFTVGVLAAGRITAPHLGDGVLWPRGVTRALTVQLVVLAAFVAGWQLQGGKPEEGAARNVLLALAALAMGLQSGAVVAIGVPGLSTTYVTGTLTGVLTTVANSRQLRWDSAAILAALVVGATFAGLMVVHAPRLAPLLPFLALTTVVLVAWRSPVFTRR